MIFKHCKGTNNCYNTQYLQLGILLICINYKVILICINRVIRYRILSFGKTIVKML